MEEQSKRKPTRWGLWLAVAMVLVFVVYPMSIYPALWLMYYEVLPSGTFWFYIPLARAGRSLYQERWLEKPEPLLQVILHRPLDNTGPYW